MAIHLTYDATTDVAYLSLRPTGPANVLGPTLLLENDREFAGAVAADFTLADGRLVGLEFQMASACLPPELFATAERIDGEHLAYRFQDRVLRRFERGTRSSATRKRDDVRH